MAAPGAARAQDGLFKVEAEGPVNVKARTVTYDEPTSSYLAEGDVEVTRGDTTLLADRVKLYSETLLAEAEGKVRLTTTGRVVEGDRMAVDMKSETGKIYKGTIFIQANHFYLRGDVIEKTGPDTYRMSRGSFTSCDGSLPAWEITSSETEVTIEGYGTARHSYFRIKGTPILYSPYMVFPVKFKRQSGLLMPRAGFSDRDGVVISQPYFQTLGDSMDATLTLNYMSERGMDVGLEYRYALTKQSKGMIMFDILPEDGAGEELFESGKNAEAYNSRYWVRGMADQTLGAWSARAHLDLVSDQDYLREFTLGYSGFDASDVRFLEEFGRNLDPYTSLIRQSYLNVSRYWTSWSFNGTTRYYDNLATDNKTTLQYLPELTLDALRQEIMKTGMYFRMDSMYTYYYREEGSTGHIADINPALSYPINLSNYLELEPRFTLKERVFSVTKDPSESGDLTESGTSELWTFDLEAQTYLYKVYQFGEGDGGFVMKHGVQPYANYSFTPALDETDVASLASRTRSRRHIVSYGVRNTFTSKSPMPEGPEGEKLFQYRDFLRVNLSHSYNIEEARRDQVFVEVTDPITGVISEVAQDREPWGNFNMRVEFRPTDKIYAEGDATYNPYTEDFVAYNALLRLSDERGDAIMMDYRYLENAVNWLSSELRLAINSEWALSYINLTDFDDDSRNFENTLQLSYSGQCWGVRALYTDTLRDQGFYLIFSLKGLGEVLGLGGGSGGS